jgi:DNA polymerase-3 subunit chi
MAEIGFYQLTRSDPIDALARLLGRTLETGARAVVRCPSVERVAAIDAALWRATTPNWLPHGTAVDGDAELQPVWITTEDEAPNGARFLFLIDGTEIAALAAFDRVFDIFDGNDPAAVAAARARWRAAKGAGHTVRYWQQGRSGWEEKG